MPLDQLIFSEVIVEAEDRHRAAQDELRSDVQHWFDEELTPRQKDVLGAWIDRKPLRGLRQRPLWTLALSYGVPS